MRCSMFKQQRLDLILLHVEWHVVKTPHVDLHKVLVDLLFIPLFLNPRCQMDVAMDPLNS